MKTLILLRHGNAQDDTDYQGDFKRSLSERGKRNAAMMGAHIKPLAHEINAVHVSTAHRTQETADIVIKEAGITVTRYDEDRLYLPATGDLLCYINQLPDTQDTVLMVGHNPGLYEIIALLCERLDDTLLHRGLPTCGLVVLRCEVETWQDVAPHMAQCESFTSP